MEKIPELLKQVLDDEDFKTAIKNDMRKTHLVDYKQRWRLGVITPDIDTVFLRKGDVHFNGVIEKIRQYGQIPLKKTAILYNPTYFGRFQNIIITGGNTKRPQSYSDITKIKKGESIPIRDLKIKGLALPKFLKEQGFSLKESYNDGDPLTTERNGIIVEKGDKITLFHPSYFVQRRLIDDEGNLIYLGKLFKEIPRRVYKPIMRYHSFPYESDTMLPVIDTPISSSEWSELVIDPRGRARLFVAKDKELHEWEEMMYELRDLFIEEVAKKEYHLLGLTKDKAHLNEYLRKKEEILRNCFLIEDLGHF